MPEDFTEQTDDRDKLILYCKDKAYARKAAYYAEKIGCEWKTGEPCSGGNTPSLFYGEEGLSLLAAGQAIKGDFTRMLPRLREANLRGEMLIKAARFKGEEAASLLAVDATAGLGEDALLLAGAGFRVELFEYDPVIAALLEDSLFRARLVPELMEVTARMHLYHENSIPAMRQRKTPPDVILLDPMFPKRQKTALVKKKFQLIHNLEQPCSNEAELLAAAKSADPRKIVIKRPLKGPFLADEKPAYSLKGKAVRYDCLLLPRHTGEG